MIARRPVVHAILCAAIIASTSGCAFAARALVAVEALDVARDVFETAEGGRPVPLAAAGAGTWATVTGTGGSGLRLNGTPGADRMGVLPDGSVALVLCTVDGPRVSGSQEETSTWSRVRTADGSTGFMSNAYLDVSGPSVPGC